MYLLITRLTDDIKMTTAGFITACSCGNLELAKTILLNNNGKLNITEWLISGELRNLCGLVDVHAGNEWAWHLRLSRRYTPSSDGLVIPVIWMLHNGLWVIMWKTCVEWLMLIRQKIHWHQEDYTRNTNIVKHSTLQCLNYPRSGNSSYGGNLIIFWYTYRLITWFTNNIKWPKLVDILHGKTHLNRLAAGATLNTQSLFLV